MKKFIYLLTVCLLSVVTGCHKDIPEPETKVNIQPVSSTLIAYDVPVFGFEYNKNEPFYVRHQVKGKDVLIECIIQGITLRNTNADNQGKILLFVDGKQKDEISSAAFIVKGLSSGSHRLKLEVVKPDNSPYHLKKEFYVTIP